MHNTKKFHKLIDELITLNKENRPKGDKFYPNEVYAHHFCLIHINIGRGSGNTSYIRNKSHENDLVVVRGEIRKRYYKYGKMITQFDIKDRRLGAIKLSKNASIFIDEASRFHPDEIYQLLMAFGNYERTFILLG